MKKFGKVLVVLIGTAIAMPLIKGVYDNFTAPITGSLVVAGVPENQLAIVGAVPWVIPVAILVWAIIYLSKPDEPGRFGGQ